MLSLYATGNMSITSVSRPVRLERNFALFNVTTLSYELSPVTFIFDFICSLPAMRVTTLYFLIILYPLTTENMLQWSRKTRHKWKSRNLQKLVRTLRLRDAENSTYYLPRASRNNVALNSSNSPSFEDVVLELKKIGILDLPNVR